jgi:hypothetical protein
VRLRAKVFALIAAAIVASCAAKSGIASVQNTWILPLSARDSEAVCVIVMDFPGRRCTTVGEIRSYVRSVKAD